MNFKIACETVSPDTYQYKWRYQEHATITEHSLHREKMRLGKNNWQNKRYIWNRRRTNQDDLQQRSHLGMNKETTLEWTKKKKTKKKKKKNRGMKKETTVEWPVENFLVLNQFFSRETSFEAPNCKPLFGSHSQNTRKNLNSNLYIFFTNLPYNSKYIHTASDRHWVLYFVSS